MTANVQKQIGSREIGLHRLYSPWGTQFGSRPSFFITLAGRAFLHLLEAMRRVGKRFAGDLALISISARPLTDLSPACVVQDFKISCVRGNVLAEGLIMRATSQASFNQCYNAQGKSLNMASNQFSREKEEGRIECFAQSSSLECVS